jgi:hypothetical protein
MYLESWLRLCFFGIFWELALNSYLSWNVWRSSIRPTISLCGRSYLLRQPNRLMRSCKS